MELPSNNPDDDQSSSDDLEIEGPLEQIALPQPSDPPLDIRHFLEIGEMLDLFNGQRWISVVVHELQPRSLCISLANNPHDTRWLDFDFLTMRKQWVTGLQFHESYRVEVRNRHQGWMEAQVIEVKPNAVKVHYSGYKKVYDETVAFDQVAPLGMHTTTLGIGTLLRREPQALGKWATRFHQYLQEWSQYAMKKLYMRLEQGFPSLLLEKGLVIKQVQGDGNCMFRAISDQLYGCEDYHRQLRMFAMEYILAEKSFFKNFVVGGDVEKYVEYKSQDTVWGDNIELQAFRELYNIPIEVYVYNNVPIKTGLEGNPEKEPIRISYHGRSHYNSLKPVNQAGKALIQHVQCGAIELERLAQLKQRQESQEIIESRTEGLLGKPNLFEDVYNESKRMFEEQMKKRDSEVVQREDAEEQLLDLAMKESQLDEQQQFQQQTLEVQILEDILEESKKQQLKEQNQQLEKMIEESEIEKALKESAQTMEKQLYDDPLMNPVIAQVMSMGPYQLEMVLEAYTVVGNDIEMIINYLYENFY